MIKKRLFSTLSNIQTAVLLLLTSLMFNSCSILESGTDCDSTRNLTLHFYYTDALGNQACGSAITNVDIFLFDINNRLVHRFEAPSAEYTTLLSATITVEPGTYRVVCSGNDRENTIIHINPGDLIEDGYISQIESSPGVVSTSDPLFYAPLDTSKPLMVTVPKTGHHDIDVEFRTGHIQIEVYVTGYEDFLTKSNVVPPTIELINLSSKYDLRFVPIPESTVFRLQSTPTVVEGIETMRAIFSAPLLRLNDGVMLYLRNTSDNGILKSVDLSKFIKEYYSNLDIMQTAEVTLQIEFKYFDGELTISIPSWENEVIKPEI